MKYVILMILALTGLYGKSSSKQDADEHISHATNDTLTANSLLDTLLADGFDFPIGDRDGKGSYISVSDGKTYQGWYVAVGFARIYTEHNWIHTGEDWNGNGGGNTDLGQPVSSIAHGAVIFAGLCPAPWGNIVLIKHNFLENGKLKSVFSQYSHLRDIFVKTGQPVKRREKIGSIGQDPDKMYPAHLHFEIRKSSMNNHPVDYWPSSHGKSIIWVKENYESPSQFIKGHRKLTVPVLENKILIAIKHKYKMGLYSKSKLQKEYTIALSQNPVGHKMQQGDNRLPEGEYKIIQKSRGPFTGDYADYIGTAWIRINYPNDFDAKNGFARGLISKEERDKILKANEQGKTPPKNTKLGGGIGIHGWAGDWVADGSQNLTWGCISMHNKDIDELYDLIPLNTKIFILP